MLDQIYHEGFDTTNTYLKTAPLLDGGEGKISCSTPVGHTPDDAAADMTNIHEDYGTDDTNSPHAHAKIRANHFRNSPSTATT
jgi:hypothetical protein